eukprot:SAG11_NODE_20689_length_440_cov_0.897361_1_plen_71_part_10
MNRPTTPTRSSREGQKGLISCLAVGAKADSASIPSHSLYAAGSYSGTAALYAQTDGQLVALLDASERANGA